MSTRLPDLSNPWRLVQLNKQYAGSEQAKSFPRLVDAVDEVVGEVAYRLHFGRDDEGRAAIDGDIRAEVRMTCRRCLEPVSLELDSSLALVLVATDAEADRLPEELDVVVLADAPMRLFDLLEDEALLSLPAYPVHAEGGCRPDLEVDTTESDEDVPERESPFAVLAGLKRDS
jgi:uncharacterized protein